MRISKQLGILLLLTACDAGAQASRDDVRLSLTLGSDYYAYGLSQANGGPSWRVAADYEHNSGFFAGGFVANVDHAYESRRLRPREQQVNYYAGFQTRGRNWSGNVALSQYEYPDIQINYDYRRINVGTAFRDRYFFNAAYSDDWLGIGKNGYQFEFGYTRPIAWNLEFGASIGRVNVDEFLGGTFNHWDAGLSKIVERFAIDLRYHSSSLTRATLLGDPNVSQWALSVAYAIAPRAP
jgi:uncharacterized protein (TIGR02001 family)